MRFLLINPFIDKTVVKDIFAIEAEIPHLGLLYLASALEKHGHQVEIVDYCIEKYSEQNLMKKLALVDAVGITVQSHLQKSVNTIVDFIKKLDPDLPVIIGGPHCTLEPEQTLHDINADISVEGDGEIAITKIAEALEGKTALNEIPGVFYRKNGEIKHGPPAEIIEDLDSLPFPARHLVEKYSYGEVQGGFNPTRGRVTSILISRGCPYNCRFCINKAITKKYRTRSAENVIEEIKEIQGKYDFLHVIDDNFFVSMKTANKILDFLIQEKTGLEIWIAGVRVDRANEELFRKMKKAGVTTISMGIESGNQEILDYYNKRITLEQIRRSVYLARKTGFVTTGYFIVGAPIETKEHIEKTIEFAKSLPIDLAVFSPFAYLKGSPIWYEAVEQGKLKRDEYTAIANVKRGLGNFAEEEMWEWSLKAFKMFYLRPSYILDQIVQSFIRRDFRIIKGGFRLLLRSDNVLKYNKEKLVSTS